MAPRADSIPQKPELPPKIQSALALLLEAYEYSECTTGDPWEFAVEVGQLREFGVSFNDLRFLVRKDLVEHASEMTVASQNGRRFQQTGDLTFTKRTCFVLTLMGVAAAGASCLLPAIDGPEEHLRAFAPDDLDIESAPSGPSWDAERRELRRDGQLVKQFKWHAVNQETVLAAFQEEGWPARIDDPLPPNGEQDSKRRLSDTIKCLNRKQANELLHFRGDGTGEGVVWEVVEENG